jgi:polar amino acid transport system permease protein
VAKLDLSVLLEYRGLLVDGTIATLELTAICILVSLLLGMAIALCRVFLPPYLSWIFAAYTEFFRNVPPLVQLFFWYFATGLPVLGAAVVGISVFSSAYIAEAFRSGLSSIPKTQLEAARSSGMTTLQSIAKVLLPQASLRIIPILSNQFVGIVKDTSVAMTIGYAELTYQTQMIETLTFRGFEAAIVATVLYFCLAYAVVLVMHQLERLLQADLRRM